MNKQLNEKYLKDTIERELTPLLEVFKKGVSEVIASTIYEELELEYMNIETGTSSNEDSYKKDLTKKLNSKTIRADKLDILKDDIHDNIIAVNEKETVYGIILSTGTLRQLSSFLISMNGIVQDVDTVTKGLVVVKYFDTNTGTIQNYLVERKWYNV